MRDESGFGLIELLISMVVLSIGILAVVGALDAATAAVGRAKYISGAVAVADQQMEQYRSLKNCAIWLDHTQMPLSTSNYAADTAAYSGIPYYDPAQPANGQYWATDGTDSSRFPQPAYFEDASGDPYGAAEFGSCGLDANGVNQLPGNLNLITTPRTSPAASSTVVPEQTLAGPDQKKYLVDVYITIHQTGEWVKQVTIVVRDPNKPRQSLAREVSDFSPSLTVQPPPPAVG